MTNRKRLRVFAVINAEQNGVYPTCLEVQAIWSSKKAGGLPPEETLSAHFQRKSRSQVTRSKQLWWPISSSFAHPQGLRPTQQNSQKLLRIVTKRRWQY